MGGGERGKKTRRIKRSERAEGEMKRLCGRMSYFASLAVSAGGPRGGTPRERVRVERFLGVVGWS